MTFKGALSAVFVGLVLVFFVRAPWTWSAVTAFFVLVLAIARLLAIRFLMALRRTQ